MLTRTSRAMRTAVNLASCFNAMPQYVALAMSAMRSHCVNCALKAVEGHCPPRLRDPERLVVVVSADIARSHLALPLFPCSVARINASFLFPVPLPVPNWLSHSAQIKGG